MMNDKGIMIIIYYNNYENVNNNIDYNGNNMS